MITRHDDLALKYVINTPSGRPESDEMPLVVMMHGRGADALDLADVAPMLDGPAGYRFVFPNAPRPWEAYPGMTFGFTWFDGWPPEGPSFAESRNVVLQFLDELALRYPMPDGKLVISGFSQGALMSLDVAFRTKQQVAGVVAMSGALFEAEMPDIAGRKSMPVLLVHGTEDELIPVNAARRARHVLEEQGLAPEYHEFRMGHQVTAESMAVVADFIQRCMA